MDLTPSDRLLACSPSRLPGYYAGYLPSAFMVGRFCFSSYWGRLSDQYGRLFVYRFSLWSMVFLQVAFGLSTNYYWAMASR